MGDGPFGLALASLLFECSTMWGSRASFVFKVCVSSIEESEPALDRS